MAGETVLVIDDSILELIYSITSNPVFIAVVAVAVGAAMLWFLGFYERRERFSKRFFDFAFEKQRGEKSIGPEEEIGIKKPSVEEKLKGKEDELKRKEDELKLRKREELAEREKLLRKKELEEKVKRERKLREREIALMRQAHVERVSMHEWVRPSGVGFDYMRGYGGIDVYGRYERGDDFLVRERQRVRSLIDSAVSRFHSGEIDEAAFSKMVLDYQRQLIDIEVQLREAVY
jgi:hypothetical protein